MQEQQQNIRDKSFFRFTSAKRYLKVFVPGFAFKHDDNNKGKDRFVGTLRLLKNSTMTGVLRDTITLDQMNVIV